MVKTFADCKNIRWIAIVQTGKGNIPIPFKGMVSHYRKAESFGRLQCVSFWNKITQFPFETRCFNIPRPTASNNIILLIHSTQKLKIILPFVEFISTPKQYSIYLGINPSRGSEYIFWNAACITLSFFTAPENRGNTILSLIAG